MPAGAPQGQVVELQRIASARTVSGAWLEEQSNRFARALLGLGLEAGDRLIVQRENSIELLALREGARRAGLVFVPLGQGQPLAEVARIARHCRAGAVVSPLRPPEGSAPPCPWLSPEALDERAVQAPGAEPPAPPPPAGATLLYTAGTTGQPKGCLRLAAQDEQRIEAMIDAFSLSAHDVHLCASPLHHSGPALFVRCHLRLGSTVVLLRRFDPTDVLAALFDHRVTTLFAVPPLWRRLLEAAHASGAPPPTLRAAFTAGAPMDPALRKALVAWLGPGRLWEFYGSTETGTVTILRPEEQLTHPSSVGRVGPGVTIRILDSSKRDVAPGEPGELYLRSPQVMTGYYGDAEATRAASHEGFLSVGDIGSVDAEGFYTLHDRKHDLIITGGVNVYPDEVEQMLRTHPDVQDAAVVGLPDDRWGERVVAAIVCREKAPDENVLRAFLRERLAGHKVPKQIVVVDALPASEIGKPLRRVVRARLAAELG